MCLEAAGAEPPPDPGLLESLTLMPFGCLFLGEKGREVFLASPAWNNPDQGLDFALDHLGWQCRKSHGEDREPRTAIQELSAALETGPVLLGPLDMGQLSYDPRRKHVGRVVDHYVVALHASEDRVMLHDPNGFAFAQLPEKDLLMAWGRELDYGRPFTLRYAFRRAEELEPQDVLQRAVASLRARAGNDPNERDCCGGAPALRRASDAIKAGVSESLAGTLVNFSLRVGARRSLDGWRFLQLSGLPDAAASMQHKAMLYGRAQYEATSGDWTAVAATLEALAEQEEAFVSALQT